MQIEKLKLKLGATRPTARQYESVRADIELDITLDHIENVGEDDLIFIEVQCGTYFGEDDIVRLEDDYDR